jgi:putative DNA primase/helicase
MALLAREGPDDTKVRDKPPAGDAIVAALKVLFSEQAEGLVELRAIGVTRHSSSARHIEVSHYAPDELGFKRLAKDARDLTLRAEGIYVTLNPVMSMVGTDAAADKHIYRRRWLLVDVDPVRPANTSATDAEKAVALERIKAIRNHLRAEGWPDPVLADSGNGFHLLYRVDLPNDESSYRLVRDSLRALAAKFDDQAVKVDTTVCNASRICKLYGTLSRKGEATDERPHRAAALLEVPRPVAIVMPESLVALAGETPTEAKVSTNGHATNGNGQSKRKGLIARDLGEDPKEAYVNQALERELTELRTASVGGRNHQLFKSAAALAQIVAAGELDQAGTINALADVARSIGLEEAELQKTIRSAFRAGSATPRDMSKVGKKAEKAEPTVADPETGKVEKLDDPHRLARAFLKAGHDHPEGARLRFWNEEWHAWREGCWRPCSDREINGQLASFCRAEFDREKSDKPVSTRLVGNVALALRGLVLVPLRDVPEQPAWLDRGDAELPDPAECLPTRSEIVHLPALLEHGPEAPGAVRPATPRYFTANVLGYRFDPNPPRPDAWLQFLQDLWPDDPESIRALQQWFGYLVTSDTSQQKILLLIGPKRSGKGTITRTLRALVGEANVAAPTLSVLASQFGCQGLIGKTVAVCPESRLTGRSDSQAIVERLLSISGEDPQSVDRKHLPAWHGTLRTRFVLLGNELPRLGDYSGALPGRMIVVKMEKSFFGKEDMTLQDRILAELPGILVWAIAGWHDLRQTGRLLQPESGKEMLEELEELTNPVGAFLAEECNLGPEFEVPVQDLYKAWKRWCEANGRDHSGDVQGFSKNLRAAVTSIKLTRPRVDGKPTRTFTGLELRDDFRVRD